MTFDKNSTPTDFAKPLQKEPEKFVTWINVYRLRGRLFFEDNEDVLYRDAIKPYSEKIARVRVEFNEGQFDE